MPERDRKTLGEGKYGYMAVWNRISDLSGDSGNCITIEPEGNEESYRRF